MFNYVISLGSNIDPEKNILKSHYYIEKLIGTIIDDSSLYVSKPVGFDSENDFINQSIFLKSTLSPDEILEKVNTIDEIFNRIRIKSGYSDRPIDIDIILSDYQGVNKEAKIPHPRWKDRAFVIVPSLDLNSHPFDKELNTISFNQNTGLYKFL